MEKLRLVYDDYMQHVVSNERFIVNEREKWNDIVYAKFAYMVVIKRTRRLGDGAVSALGSKRSTVDLHTNGANRTVPVQYHAEIYEDSCSIAHKTTSNGK